MNKVNKLTQSENDAIETKKLSVKDKVLALIEQTNEKNLMVNTPDTKFLTRSYQLDISKIMPLPPLSDDVLNFEMEQIRENQFKNLNENFSKRSRVLNEEFKRKETLEEDRHNELISALELNNNQHILANENKQLKAEIEKVKQENILLNDELSKLKSGIEINTNSQLLLISALFAKYKAEKPRVRTQDKTLKDIEDENIDISGLSFSQTSKIMAIANNIYKKLKNNN